jgi:O-antigen/teichoic acid export membrane protein
MKFLLRLLERMPPIAQKTFGSVFLRFAAIGLQFLGSVLIARQLGPAGFGAYVYAFTWATLIGSVLGLGLGQLSVREVPKYLAHSQHGALRGYLALWVTSLLATGSIAGGILAALDAGDLFRFDVGWPLVLLVAITHAAVLGLSSFLSGFQRILQSQFFENILRQSLFLSVILVCIVLQFELDTVRVLQFSVVTVLPVIFMMGWLLHRSVSQATGNAPASPEFSTLAWLAASLPLLLSTLTTQMQTSLDTLVLGAMVDDSDLGLFRAASRGAELAMIAQGLAFRVLGPMLSRTLALQDHEEAQGLVSQSAVLSSVFGLTICAALAAFPETYLDLFGAGFREAVPVLWILVATQLVSIFCGPVALIIHRREKLVLFVTLVGLGLNFGLKVMLIPGLGTIGAALATFAAVAVVKVALLALVIRETGFDPTIIAPIRRLFSK